jgi:hypothetical protein
MLALAQAGFGIAEASSRRGRDRTTFLGAVGAAGTNFAKNIMQLNREADAERRGIAKERLALAQAESAGDRADYVAAYDQLEKRITRLDEQRFRMQTLIEQRLDRVMRQSLGMAQIAESRASREADRDLRERGVVVQERLATATEDKNFATIKTEALANAYDALEKLQSNPAFMKLSTEEQYRKAEEIFKRFEAVAVQRLRNSGFVSGNNPYAQLSDDDLRKRLGI